MGYMRLEAGKNLLGIESEIAWATPGSFTVHNFPCSEDGKNCVNKHDKPVVATQVYEDPSTNIPALHERLAAFSEEETTATKIARRHIRA